MLLKLPFPDIHVSSENDPVAAPLIEGVIASYYTDPY